MAADDQSQKQSVAIARDTQRPQQEGRGCDVDGAADKRPDDEEWSWRLRRAVENAKRDGILFVEQDHKPDASQNEVGDACSQNCQPIHLNQCVNHC